MRKFLAQSSFFLAVFFLIFGLPSFAFEEKFIFTRNLSLGLSGSDVFNLQKILNSDPMTKIAEGPGSKGNETEYFGPKTKEAVIRFQNKYAPEILYPLGLSFGTGFVGALTIKKLAFLLLSQNFSATLPENAANPVVSPVTLPSFSINTKEISEGSQVLISGNFKASDVLGVYVARKLEGGAGKLEKIQGLAAKDGSVSFNFSIPFSLSLTEDFTTYKKLSKEVYEKIWTAFSEKFAGTGDKFLVPIFMYVETKDGISVPLEASIKFEK